MTAPADALRAKFEAQIRDKLVLLAGRKPLIEAHDALDLMLAAYALALEQAAKVCEQKWRDGYRGEAGVGFAHVIRALAGLDAEP